jgi:peptide/nickel transport system permease protein
MSGRLRLPRAIPLADPATRRGSRLVLSTGFYALLVVVAGRWGAWAGATGVDRALVLALGGALYALAVAGDSVLPRAMRPVRRRFRSNRSAAAGLGVIVVLGGLALAAPIVATADPTAVSSPSTTRYQPPGAAHPLGTDRYGRDVWSRVIYGGRASFGVCALSVIVSLLFGTAVGALSGISGRRVDDVIMRVVDGMLAFPRLLLVLTAVAFLPAGAVVLALLIAATSWMGVARVVRGEIRRMRGREFVEAAIATGVGRGRLVAAHMLPNTVGHVIVAGTLNAGAVILLESSLSFLGLGVQPPAPSWGSMVFEGRDALAGAWWVSAAPALAITLAVVAFNVVGDGLRDALDARTSRAA